MRRWLKTLYDNQYFPAVAPLGDTPQDQQISQQWADWMKQQWHDHGLTELKQQRNLMTEVRQALKQQLGEDHRALEAMNFTRDEWIQINVSINDTVAARNEQQGLIEQPDAIVDRAKMLLDSQEWAEVAAGLAVVTGRRCTELLQTAEFTYESPYSVWFTGALKRRKEAMELRFEIPTLAPAKQVIAALRQLRKTMDTKGLDLETINRKFSPPVAKACDRYFTALVPQRAGRGNLYTHLFRTIYARIATHWYAPPAIADIEYMAAIQGHFLVQNEQDPKLRRSLASTRHYNDYKIGDGQGNIDGRQGVRLRDPGVTVLKIFEAAAPQFEPEPSMELDEPMIRPSKRKSPQRDISTLRLYQDERDRWMEVLDHFEPRGTQQEKMSVVLKWLEQSIQGQVPEDDTHDLEQLANLFIEPLQPLKDPEAIRTLCRQEISDLEQEYYPEDYLPLYQAAIATAIRSGQLPLIDGQTAERISYTKQGVSYEQRTHFALLFFDDLDYKVESADAPSSSKDESSSPRPPLPTPSTSTATLEPAESPPADHQQLDVLTQTLAQLVQLMQPESISPQETPDVKSEDQQQPARPEEPVHSPEPPPPNLDTPSSPPPTQKSQDVSEKPSRRGRRTSTGAEAKIKQAIDAIMLHNNQPHLAFEQKWVVSASALKRLTKCYQGVIQRVLEAHQPDIDHHHQVHGLNPRHNIRHGRAGIKIEDVIQLDDD